MPNAVQPESGVLPVSGVSLTPYPVALHFLSLLLGHLCNQSSKPGASWRWQQEELGSRLDTGRLARPGPFSQGPTLPGLQNLPVF